VEYGLAAGAQPSGISAGPDKNVWFTDYMRSEVGRITPGGAEMTWTLPTASAGPTQIAAGPDGNVWLVEQSANKIARVTPTGGITEFPIPTPGSGAVGIALGPDGALWFTEASVGKIGRVQVFISGDVDGSGIVDVGDVFYLINFLFAGGPAPQ
jgi:virginiamycin B lyase